MPRVTVIIPTFNGKQFIAQAIESVLNQTLADLELIIIDDGSNDGTQGIIQEYAHRDQRIRSIIRARSSGGPTVPKNLALSMARSPYISFLDHDDYYHLNKLKLLCEGLDANPQWVAAFHDVQLVDINGTFYQGTYLSNADFKNAASMYMNPVERDWINCSRDFYKFMSLRYAAMHTDSVMLAPLRLLTDPVSFRVRFLGSDDTDLWLRVGSQGTLGYMDRTLAYYRQHSNNLSLDGLAMTRNAVEVHESNYLHARHYMDQSERLAYRKKIANYQIDLGYRLNAVKKYEEAQHAYLKAIGLDFGITPSRGFIKASILRLIDGS